MNGARGLVGAGCHTRKVDVVRTRINRTTVRAFDSTTKFPQRHINASSRALYLPSSLPPSNRPHSSTQTSSRPRNKAFINAYTAAQFTRPAEANSYISHVHTCGEGWIRLDLSCFGVGASAATTFRSPWNQFNFLITSKIRLNHAHDYYRR
ncbi:hypothetical protein BC830DRAFT_1120241 [Chytriomyces sp. MP71]|nr:hypothetical protein BC830DRAFT_1120241 [Chytriomyces sp. MP71]